MNLIHEVTRRYRIIRNELRTLKGITVSKDMKDQIYEETLFGISIIVNESLPEETIQLK